MTSPAAGATLNPVARRPKVIAALSRFFSLENRYLPPLFITRTLLAIGTAMAFELVLSRYAYGKFPHLASAYISGISVGILVRSPEYWPYALTSAIAITSKYVLRWKGRHLWNPSNFAICAMLLLAPDYFATLSVQWGNTLWPMMEVWTLGAFIVYRVKRFHITGTYVLCFVILAALRSQITGHPLLSEIAPITGPMYQLFIFFMITDPKTNVNSRWGQYVVAVLVAIVEMLLRLAQNINAPFYALTIVGPAAVMIEIWWTSRNRSGQPLKTP
jgi:enediyne biosynthesis protein E5